MLSPDARIARIAQRQHGAFSRAQAYDAGIAPHTLRAGVRSGRWTTPHRDVFVIAGTPSTYEQCVMTAQLCAGRGAAAAARTAARLWKLTERDNKCVQLLVPAERHLAIPGVEIIRTRNALAKDFTHIGAIRITTPTRTVIDLASDVRQDELEDVLDEALRRQLTTVALIEQRMKPMGRGCEAIDVLRELIAARKGKRPIGSKRQGKLLRLLEGNGLPRPEVEYDIYAPDGSFVGRVDFAYPRYRLAIEFDGLAHASRRQWEKDVARQNRLTRAGWRFLRFTSTALDSDPASIVKEVDAELCRSVVRD